ncbi:MAG: S-layer homology domain-containing protein, partial [Oscillospiraceae bacterium]
DVPADSYCAGAVATAESLWIAQGSGGRFYPDRPLTRQDGMALIQRTMRATGWSLPDGSPTLLAGFSDRDAISPHAVGAVAALVQLGIVQGDWQGRLNPKATLSRAEMAVILHRVLTL